MDSPLLLGTGAVDSTGSSKVSPRPDIPQMRRQIASRQHIVTSTVMHGVLLIIHIVLLCIWARHYEHRATFAFNTFSASFLPTLLTIGTQTIGVAYLSIIVLLTQRLALRTDLSRTQTLTAIHDKNNAWLGLGSAIVSTYQQFRLRAAGVGVASILVYLLGVFALHVTIPSMLHAEPFNDTATVVVPTVLANASFWQGSTAAFDILTVYGQFPTLGLKDNMVYDVIPEVANSIGTTTVNASIYNVTCGAIPDAVVTEYDDVQWFQSQFGVSSPENTAFEAILRTTPYYPSLVSSIPILQNYSMPPGIVIASTVPIVDSGGDLPPGQPSTPLQHPVLQLAWINDYAYIRAIQVVACAVAIDYVTVEVSTQTRLPASCPSPPRSRIWTNISMSPDTPSKGQDPHVYAALTLPAYSTFSALSLNATVIEAAILTNDTDLSSIVPDDSAMVTKILDSSSQSLESALGNGTAAPIQPNTFDVFLMKGLNITVNTTNIQLADLDRGLSNALAAVYWYGKNLDYSSPFVVEPGIPPQDVTDGMGEADVTVSVVRVRLNLTLTPIIIGIVASAVLCLLFTTLVRLPSLLQHQQLSSVSALDTGGILQITWLLGHEQPLAVVAEPTTILLRRAGMFPVHMDGVARQRIHLAWAESLSIHTDDEDSKTAYQRS